MISITCKGDFRKTETFLNKLRRQDFLSRLDEFGKKGVDALASATPTDTGATAMSWSYEIHRSTEGVSIVWTNSNMADGVPIAVLLQYGHGTGTGGYVEGRDYINPAIRPVFDEIANQAMEEVRKL